LAQGSSIARRYARALFEAAQAAGVTAEVGRDLAVAVAVIWGDDKVRAFFTGNRTPTEAKKRLVTQACGWGDDPAGGGREMGKGLERLVGNFLLLAVDKRREEYVAEVAGVYASMVDRAAGLVDVEVRTAVDLGEGGRDKLSQALAEKLGRRVRTSFVIDPSLLGGLEIKIDDRLFDASLRRRLVRLGEHLAKARVGV
jgi:F-type H+-transporting ATPase subunit delta